jgi:hypothetical protein
MYRDRANLFLRRSAPKLEKVFPIFPIFSEVKLEKLASEKILEKNGSVPPKRKQQLKLDYQLLS